MSNTSRTCSRSARSSLPLRICALLSTISGRPSTTASAWAERGRGLDGRQVEAPFREGDLDPLAVDDPGLAPQWVEDVVAVVPPEVDQRPAAREDNVDIDADTVAPPGGEGGASAEVGRDARRAGEGRDRMKDAALGGSPRHPSMTIASSPSANAGQLSTMMEVIGKDSGASWKGVQAVGAGAPPSWPGFAAWAAVLNQRDPLPRFRIAEDAVARMPAETPADRVRRLVDAIIVWITPDRPLEPGINRFEVRVSDAGDTWLERLRGVKMDALRPIVMRATIESSETRLALQVRVPTRRHPDADLDRGVRDEPCALRARPGCCRRGHRPKWGPVAIVLGGGRPRR